MLEAMEVDLVRLAEEVREELDAFVTPSPNPAALGTPLPPEWYAMELAAMRKSLVPPYWIQMRDLDPSLGRLVILNVVVVADDGDGTLVAYDPQNQGEFVLAQRGADPDAERGVGIVSCGVRGDVVGCFLSR